MEKKYISENRYKKTSRKEKRPRQAVKKPVSKSKNQPKVKKTVDNINSTSAKQVKKVNVAKTKKVEKSVKTTNVTKPTKPKFKFKTGFKVALILIAIVSLASILRLVTKEQQAPFLPIFSTKEPENTESVTIAVNGSSDLSTFKGKDLFVTEMRKSIYSSLLTIDSDYNIKYDVISKVVKLSNKEYEIYILDVSLVSASDVKGVLEANMKETEIYNSKVANIDRVEVLSDKKLKVTLKKDDPYFVYNLDIEIEKDKSSGKYEVDKTLTNINRLSLLRKTNVNDKYLQKINLINVSGLETAVDKYKKEQIDAFFSSTKQVQEMLGRYEYNIKAYNSGESIFLFGNPNSDKFGRREVRKAISYSIDRASIIKDVAKGDGILIDMPYVYDNVKYKYDIYEANNLLLSNGYKKSGGVYSKQESGNTIRLELNLLVNKSDSEKKKIAKEIKKDLSQVGILVNIEELSTSKINSRVKEGTYDLILATIYTNENPDVSHLTKYLSVNSSVKTQIENTKNSQVDTLRQEVSKLANVLSNEAACIGIYARPTYVIYEKDLKLFDSISYASLLTKYFESVDKENIE